MSRRVQRYDAFSGMGPAEKADIVKFLFHHSDDKDSNTIREAIDYALKNKPSFGGFIFTCWEANQPIAVVLVNNTGMSGFSPQYLLVFACLHPDYHAAPEILSELVQQAVRQCRGEIALHLKPDSPALPVFQALGFREQYLELRFSEPQIRASVG
jgi:hypothetical protein